MPAIPDYYIGFTQVEVETIFAKLKTELVKVIANYATNGDSVTRIQRDALRLEIRGCQKALQKFDPSSYGGGRVRSVTSRVIGHLSR